MAKRKKLSNRTRFDVFKRDRFQCQYCGRTPPSVILEVDHVIAVSTGGTDDEGNLVTSCYDCNRGKGAGDLKQCPAPLAEQMKDREERERQLEEYNQFLLSLRERQQDRIDEIGRYWFNQFEREKDAYIFGPVRQQTIRTFLRELTPVEIMEAVEIAFGKVDVGRDDEKTWRYFCGVCWRKIKRARGEEV